MFVIEHADDHHVAGAAELSVSVRRRCGRSETVALAPIGAPFSSPKGKSVRLRCASDVAVVQAADLGQSDDAAVLGWLDGAALGCIPLEREAAKRSSRRGAAADVPSPSTSPVESRSRTRVLGRSRRRARRAHSPTVRCSRRAVRRISSISASGSSTWSRLLMV